MSNFAAHRCRPFVLAVAALVSVTGAGRSEAAEPIVLAAATSLDNTGLLDRILPEFTRASGIKVRVVAVGTAQVLAIAARGDADLVLAHDPEAEDSFMAEGHGVLRREIAWNDDIVVGPSTDPAHIAGGHDATAALKAIAAAKAHFDSRGDRGGIDVLEKGLWRDAMIDPVKAGGGLWYHEIGGGMGATLNAASATNAYTICDRGTWLSFKKTDGLRVLVEGDPHLVNHFDVILLDPKRHPEAQYEAAKRLADWLLSAGGQTAIGAFQLQGEQLFHPSAMPK
jgi:tungstate transport system substrate-binding protein